MDNLEDFINPNEGLGYFDDNWNFDYDECGNPVTLEEEPVAPPQSEYEAYVDWEQATWHDNPFFYHTMPFGYYYEKEGYLEFAKLAINKPKSIRTTTYDKMMPKTYALAEQMYESIGCHTYWGVQLRQGDKGWTTFNHEKDDNGRLIWKEYHYSKATAAKLGKSTYFAPPPTMKLLDILKSLAHPNKFAVSNKDIDVDYEKKYHHIRIDIDCDKVFDHDYADDLVKIIKVVKAAYAAKGLTCYIMRTGHRGLQTLCAVEGVSWDEINNAIFDIEDDIYIGFKENKLTTLAKVDKSNTDSLMRLPLGRHAFSSSIALFINDDGNVVDVDLQADYTIKSLCDRQPIDMSLFVKLQDTIDCIQLAKVEEEKSDDKPDTKVVRQYIPKGQNGLKRYIERLMSQDYTEGESFHYLSNKGGGLNMIGMVKYYFDSDCERTIDWLVEQSERVGGDAVETRNELIRRWVPKNNRPEWLHMRSTGEIKDYRDIVVNIKEDDVKRADNLIEALVSAQVGSTIKKRKFEEKALATIKRILEICLAGGENISVRSLAAECGVAQIDVQRQLAWITKDKSNCILPILQVSGGKYNVIS